MAVEEEFGGTISDEEAQQLKTVGDAVKYVEEKMS
jgi:acyl carrier protein